MTLGELKARVADELNRDDLTTQIATSVTAAIYQWGATRFWKTESAQTSTTTLGGQYADVPAGMRVVDIVQVQVGGTWYPLKARTLAEIEDWHGAASNQGQPTDYAIEGTRVRLYPAAADAYALAFTGIFSLPALADDDDTNFWTEEAADLIVATAKYRLYRDVIRDAEAMTFAKAAENEALEYLRDETNRKLATGIRPWL